jgi:hypothetical protein
MKDTKMDWGLIYRTPDGRVARRENPRATDEQLPMLRLDDLMAGATFFYNGHFTRLRDYFLAEAKPIELRFDKETASVITPSGETWSLIIATAERFAVYRAEFGNIFILFKECQVKELANAIV